MADSRQKYPFAVSLKIFLERSLIIRYNEELNSIFDIAGRMFLVPTLPEDFEQFFMNNQQFAEQTMLEVQKTQFSNPVSRNQLTHQTTETVSEVPNGVDVKIEISPENLPKLSEDFLPSNSSLENPSCVFLSDKISNLINGKLSRPVSILQSRNSRMDSSHNSTLFNVEKASLISFVANSQLINEGPSHANNEDSQNPDRLFSINGNPVTSASRQKINDLIDSLKIKTDIKKQKSVNLGFCPEKDNREHGGDLLSNLKVMDTLGKKIGILNSSSFRSKEILNSQKLLKVDFLEKLNRDFLFESRTSIPKKPEIKKSELEIKDASSEGSIICEETELPKVPVLKIKTRKSGSSATVFTFKPNNKFKPKSFLEIKNQNRNVEFNNNEFLGNLQLLKIDGQNFSDTLPGNLNIPTIASEKVKESSLEMIVEGKIEVESLENEFEDHLLGFDNDSDKYGFSQSMEDLMNCNKLKNKSQNPEIYELNSEKYNFKINFQTKEKQDPFENVTPQIIKFTNEQKNDDRNPDILNLEINSLNLADLETDNVKKIELKIQIKNSSDFAAEKLEQISLQKFKSKNSIISIKAMDTFNIKNTNLGTIKTQNTSNLEIQLPQTNLTKDKMSRQSIQSVKTAKSEIIIVDLETNLEMKQNINPMLEKISGVLETKKEIIDVAKKLKEKNEEIILDKNEQLSKFEVGINQNKETIIKDEQIIGSTNPVFVNIIKNETEFQQELKIWKTGAHKNKSEIKESEITSLKVLEVKNTSNSKKNLNIIQENLTQNNTKTSENSIEQIEGVFVDPKVAVYVETTDILNLTNPKTDIVKNTHEGLSEKVNPVFEVDPQSANLATMNDRNSDQETNKNNFMENNEPLNQNFDEIMNNLKKETQLKIQVPTFSLKSLAKKEKINSSSKKNPKNTSNLKTVKNVLINEKAELISANKEENQTSNLISLVNNNPNFEFTVLKNKEKEFEFSESNSNKKSNIQVKVFQEINSIKKNKNISNSNRLKSPNVNFKKENSQKNTGKSNPGQLSPKSQQKVHLRVKEKLNLKSEVEKSGRKNSKLSPKKLKENNQNELASMFRSSQINAVRNSQNIKTMTDSKIRNPRAYQKVWAARKGSMKLNKPSPGNFLEILQNINPEFKILKTQTGKKTSREKSNTRKPNMGLMFPRIPPQAKSSYLNNRINSSKIEAQKEADENRRLNLQQTQNQSIKKIGKNQENKKLNSSNKKSGREFEDQQLKSFGILTPLKSNRKFQTGSDFPGNFSKLLNQTKLEKFETPKRNLQKTGKLSDSSDLIKSSFSKLRKQSNYSAKDGQLSTNKSKPNKQEIKFVTKTIKKPKFLETHFSLVNKLSNFNEGLPIKNRINVKQSNRFQAHSDKPQFGLIESTRPPSDSLKYNPTNKESRKPASNNNISLSVVSKGQNDMNVNIHLTVVLDSNNNLELNKESSRNHLFKIEKQSKDKKSDNFSNNNFINTKKGQLFGKQKNNLIQIFKPHKNLLTLKENLIEENQTNSKPNKVDTKRNCEKPNIEEERSLKEIKNNNYQISKGIPTFQKENALEKGSEFSFQETNQSFFAWKKNDHKKLKTFKLVRSNVEDTKTKVFRITQDFNADNYKKLSAFQSPYGLKNSNDFLRKNFDIELKRVDWKSRTTSSGLYNGKFQVVKKSHLY